MRRVRERRTAQRFDLEIDVSYQVERDDDTATLRNISTSGALIEAAPKARSVGTKMVLSLSLFPGARPIEIPAEVVRETESGFVLKFRSLDARTEKLLRGALPKAAAQSAKRR